MGLGNVGLELRPGVGLGLGLETGLVSCEDDDVGGEGFIGVGATLAGL